MVTGKRTARAVSTHSHPKVAAARTTPPSGWLKAFQHTAARRRMNPDMRGSATEPMFQHTAA